jgi:spermidine/putrescine transport system substrate-binding protein
MKLLKTLATVFFASLPVFSYAGGKVIVYNWSEYIPEELLKQFTQETGIEVEYSVYESNESMYAKIKLLGGSGYDIVVPSGYYISKMREEGLLKEIDKSKIPNVKNLDSELLNKAYDPGNKYSIPYFWGSTGIGINSAEIPYNSITAWKDLWDKKWANSLLLTDDVREVFHMALRQLGYSGNTTNEAEIKQAYELLKQLMPNVVAFNSDAPRMPFLSGDVNLGMIWNGEVSQAQAENKNIQYIYPKEGAIFWVDSFAIPVKAPNSENALKFINFMLRPESAKACVEFVGYATANRAALPLLDQKIRDNKTIFPDSTTIANGEFHTDVGPATAIYEKYWQLLKAGK